MTAPSRAALATSLLLAIPFPAPIELPAESTRSAAPASGSAGCRKKAVTAPDASPTARPVSAAAPGASDRSASTAVPAAPPTDDLWSTKVRPMLAERCAPCHVPGGKMYARLPFDDPAVLRSHEAGAKKRLKGEDAELFARWLAAK